MTTTKYSQTIKGNKDAAKSHKRLADLLTVQIKARKRSLTGLKKQYDNALVRNANTRRLVVSDLLGGFKTAQQGYDRSEKDATANLGTTAVSAQLNRAREGASAMAELSNMQAGLTDRIKGMGASVRNMKVNLEGGANDYASAITGINNSLGDLNTNMRTNINNALREENSNDAQAFAEFSAGNQQGYADMVDLFGQRGSAYEQMADMLATKKSSTTSSGTTNISSTQKDSISQTKQSKKAIKKVKKSYAGAGDAANKLADWMGKAYGTRASTIDEMNAREKTSTMRFIPAAMKQNQSNLDDLANAGTLRKLVDAEGSKLRKRVVT